MAEVQADAGVPRLESSSSIADERRRVGELVGDHFERDADAERLGERGRSPRRCARGAPAAVVAGGCSCEAGVPRCTTSTSNGMRLAICSAASVSRTAASRRAGVADRVRIDRAPRRRRRRSCSVIGAWTLCSVSPVSFSHCAEPVDRRRVVIVEVAAGGEQLDRLEAVARRSAPGDPARAAGRGTGAWKCRSAWTVNGLRRAEIPTPIIRRACSRAGTWTSESELTGR